MIDFFTLLGEIHFSVNEINWDELVSTQRKFHHATAIFTFCLIWAIRQVKKVMKPRGNAFFASLHQGSCVLSNMCFNC